MKRIYNKLKKLFPNDIVLITHSLKKYSTHEEQEEYQIYINSNIYPYNWNPEFNNLEDLETHLKEKIKGY